MGEVSFFLITINRKSFALHSFQPHLFYQVWYSRMVVNGTNQQDDVVTSGDISAANHTKDSVLKRSASGNESQPRPFSDPDIQGTGAETERMLTCC